MDDIHKYKNRMLITYAQKILPKIFMRTPRMKAIRRRIDHVYSMIRNSHTPAQRENQPRDLIDDLLSLHASDPQYFPDTDTRFMMIIPFVAAMYMGTAVAFGLYLMVDNPDRLSARAQGSRGAVRRRRPRSGGHHAGGHRQPPTG